MSRGVWRCVAALAASGTWCLAQTAQPSGRMATDAGVDFRFYNVYSDNPVAYQNNQTAETATDTQKGTYYDYCRLRTRPWGRMRVDDQYELYMRLGNEFRAYDNNKQLYPFPDELYIDNLYVDLDDLWRDRLSVRLGRQDLKYGAGRVIRDGTPASFAMAPTRSPGLIPAPRPAPIYTRTVPAARPPRLGPPRGARARSPCGAEPYAGRDDR